MTAYGSLISDLETAISSGNAERCVEALWQVTDLFITGAGQYSLEHATLFDDVIVRLAAEIEVKARVPNSPTGLPPWLMRRQRS
jgi:hypothetical protein